MFPQTPSPEELADRIARRFKVMAEPRRVLILDQLRNAELSVNEIADRLGCGQQNLSKHLAVPADARIVARRKEGNHVSTTGSPTRRCSSSADRLQRQLDHLAVVVAEAA